MGLLCESEGWHPEPELVWLDSKGVHLSAGPPETHRDLDGFYTVKRHVIVQETDTNHFTCRVQQSRINEKMETEIHLPIVGSKPVVSIEGHREGGMGLLCESEGWHPEPELVWLDSKGVNLSAGPPETHRDFKGFYRVKQHVIVQETDTTALPAESNRAGSMRRWRQRFTSLVSCLITQPHGEWPSWCYAVWEPSL
ncbi:butyrophilin subfamily 2 member A1-like [Oncorhynchus nerka]|uniref:butyrophilin subfamily 2 member A1-like n=1 Tax=Oncorhynchus nerka TaxID=8023 RepID=UPI0031B852A7